MVWMTVLSHQETKKGSGQETKKGSGAIEYGDAE